MDPIGLLVLAVALGHAYKAIGVTALAVPNAGIGVFLFGKEAGFADITNQQRPGPGVC